MFDHERAVRVVVLEEGNQRRGDADDLPGEMSMNWTSVASTRTKSSLAGQHVRATSFPFGSSSESPARARRLLLVGAQVLHVLRQPAVLHDAISVTRNRSRRRRVDRERADEADVRAFGRLDRTDAA